MLFRSVLEGASWFKDHGSSTSLIQAVVKGAGKPTQSVSQERPNRKGLNFLQRFRAMTQRARNLMTSSFQPGGNVPFGMHGIPHEKVAQLLKESQCELIVMSDSDSAGDEWEDHWYVVTKKK